MHSLFNILGILSAEQKTFLSNVQKAMESYFGDDQRRIEHAMQVSCYAEDLLTYIEADPVLTLTSAYLHDIGIPEAERKHGSSSGKWQELEGPPIATMLLADLGADRHLIEFVAEIIGNHHTAGVVDSPEFRIIWDADALVNFSGAFSSKNMEQIENILKCHMVTEPGFQMARKLFLPKAESDMQCPISK